ncbi:MAG TPA: metallophosphoesterase [Casimicrobiaceae bacterium]|nr:metallophosphoesterase [Casimicrobiaceae bacterium]
MLLTSDLHYKLRQYDWLIGAAPHFDAVVIAGDHLDAALAVPASVQIAALSASFGAVAGKTHLLVCSGNHDLNAWSPEGEKTADWLDAARGKALAVDGDTVAIGDTLFTVCPWWDGPFARARVEQLLDDASHRRTGRWVWIYHAPPTGPLSWTGKRHYGDAVLPALIERYAPSAVLCGHIHEAPFKADGSWVDRMGDTWLFNAGRQIGDVPARVEIDFTRETARWVSLAGIDDRSLQ